MLRERIEAAHGSGDGRYLFLRRAVRLDVLDYAVFPARSHNRHKRLVLRARQWVEELGRKVQGFGLSRVSVEGPH